MRSLFSRLPITVFATCLGICGVAQAQAPHVHGKAQMRIAIEGKRLVVALEIPQESLVGFERVPKGQAELAKAQAAVAVLQDTARVFTLTAAATCTSKTVKIDAPRLQADPNAAPAKGASQHADVNATYAFECAQIERLETLTANVFDSFKSIKEIQVQMVGGKRQTTLRISAAKRVVPFK